MSDNIKVVVKVRPLIPREVDQKLSYQWRVKNNTLYQLDQNGRDFGSCFTFDKVYDNDAKTQDVYTDIAKPIVEAAISGYNGTIFAYGQTSSGKTYTMTGTEQSPGIIPMAVQNLFDIIRTKTDRDFLVRVSYIEIYNETLTDLLNIENKNMKIRDTLGGVKVEALTETMTSTPEELLEIMKKGEANRQTGATRMNEESSRSHSILQIIIESREHIEGESEGGCANVSQLNLVDLAGSERPAQIGATGIRFKEGTHINKSLTVLGMVIKQLSEDPNKYVNYRDSKLTRILQNSLGGNAKTSIVCAVTPASIDETISTLQFANRAKAIKNKPEVNAVATDATMIQSLTKQLSKFMSQLEAKKNIEQDNVNLQKQIAALQKLILNGFGQRSHADMIGINRRKLQPLRRVTISGLPSTLHPIEEDQLPAIPKFCTPSLKYNPMVIYDPAEFQPKQNNTKLPSLPEEPIRMVTPPPDEKRVTFVNDEVIELDSDDDDSSEVKTCSPYHKCYDKTKTPPCVLRNIAKKATRDLHEIVELTEREKIYTPSVVEVMEKLEKNTSIISRLEEKICNMTKENQEKDTEINLLRDKIVKAEEEIGIVTAAKVEALEKLEKNTDLISNLEKEISKINEKDTEIEQLKNRIVKAEEEVKIITAAKNDLDKLCKTFNTKSIDWEVSYESLERKAKNREIELLSLLEEQKVTNKRMSTGNKRQSIDKLLERNIDREALNHTRHTANDSLSVNANNCVDLEDLKLQLENKNKIVEEFEKNVSLLESSKQELQSFIDCLNLKVMNLETENTLLQSTINKLNSTVESQKCTLEAANDDIKSYTGLIQDMQITLSSKESKYNVNLNDQMIETMIMNKDKFVANNENIKNILQSFRLALDSRNQELDDLKSEIRDASQKAAENATLKEHIQNKDKQIDMMLEDIEKLQDQAKENIEVINKLVNIKQEMNSKINDMQNYNHKLQEENEKITKFVKCLEEDNIEFTKTVDAKDKEILDIVCKNEALLKEISCISLKLTELQNDVSTKDQLISSLTDISKEIESHLLHTKTSADKINAILLILGNSYKIEEYDKYEVLFQQLHKGLEYIEVTVTDLIKERKQIIENDIELKKEMTDMADHAQLQLTNIKTELSRIIIERDGIVKQNEDLSIHIKQLTEEVKQIRNELDIKQQVIRDMEKSDNDAREDNENLRRDILSKDDIISSLKEKNVLLSSKIQSLPSSEPLDTLFKNEIEQLTTTIETNKESFNQILKLKDIELDILSNKTQDLEKYLDDSRKEILTATESLSNTLKNNSTQLSNILEKLTELVSNSNLQVNVTYDMECNIGHSLYEQIINTITELSNCTTEDESAKNMLSVAKDQVRELMQRNITLINDCSEIDLKNEELLHEIEKLRNINKKLSSTDEVLEQLRIEVCHKAKEIEDMHLKTTELFFNFNEYETLKNQDIEKLEKENESLKIDLMNTEQRLLKQSSAFMSNSNDDIIRKSFSNTQTELNRTSPQSLLTICCNKIIDNLQLSEFNVSPTTSNSKVSIALREVESQTDICQCIQLTSQLNAMTDENLNLKNVVMYLKSANQHLMEEQDAIRNEIQLLLEPANELQKKITNHRTNLSTLTATTYAENKLLHSKLKVLNHHYTRHIHVCQRDIPAVKSQLHELMTVLKGNAAVVDKQNNSIKRYSLPDVLDKNSSISNFKNDSTLDSDLLMLDTNVTLTTIADNTLVGHDQTCLDVTQINFDNEVACQTNDLSKAIDPYAIYSQLEILTSDNQKMYEQIDRLTKDNKTLREQLNVYLSKTPTIYSMKNVQTSPIKLNYIVNEDICEKGKNIEASRVEQGEMSRKLETLTEELTSIKAEKLNFERKYTDLTLEIISTDALVKKMGDLEKENNIKIDEVIKMSRDLNKKNILIKDLQDENDALSTQVMENISEADDLKKELDALRQAYICLTQKHDELLLLLDDSKSTNFINSTLTCSKCALKDNFISSLQNKETPKFNRSLSDSDSSSRYNKICTLQSELHASKEDCKKITEDVATIKNHLEQSNLSISQAMDLDESLNEGSIFNSKAESQIHEFCLPHIQKDMHNADIYTFEKTECINYYIEVTGEQKEDHGSDLKIIDVMKMLYNNLLTKHGNEVENLLNKLRDFEECKNESLVQIGNLRLEHSKLVKDFEEKDNSIRTVTNILSHVRNNLSIVNLEISKITSNGCGDVAVKFKDSVLKEIDSQFQLSCSNIFEYIIKNFYTNQKELDGLMDRYTQLQKDMESILTEFKVVNENLDQIKSQLAEKERDYDLLKVKNEKIQEICNAVTLDIVKKEQSLNNMVKTSSQMLIELNLMSPSDIDLNNPISDNVQLLMDMLIRQLQNKGNSEMMKENLILELKQSKTVLEEKERMLEEFRVNVVKTDNELKAQKCLYDDLHKMFEDRSEENKANLNVIANFIKGLGVIAEVFCIQADTGINNKVLAELKQKIEDIVNENINLKSAVDALESKINIQDSESKEKRELHQEIQNLIKECDELKSVNSMITEEQDSCNKLLAKSNETVQRNKAELDKMTSDIQSLTESIKQNVSVIEGLKEESKSLHEQNIQLKHQFEQKCQDYSRLEMNIKTHEKTAEIQSRMIIRHQKQKEDDDKTILDKSNQLEQLTQKLELLQKECQTIRDNTKTYKEEIDRLNEIKNNLEMRVSELEAEIDAGQKHQMFAEFNADDSRRRRQSIHDSKRLLAEDKMNPEDHDKLEARFASRTKPDDLFLDAEDHSNRSTPRLSRGRDSLSRTDQSDKDEEVPSRPSSVMATRRRRQSIHDQHRNTFLHTPSPHDTPMLTERLSDVIPMDTSTHSDNDSAVRELKQSLESCQKELEDLRERYAELDDECETCAQYLREREEQCTRLKKERGALETQVKELTEKLNNNQHLPIAKSFINASVNTDEDWANLHSVVVDRMSFDAEVEKNKKLTKTIEELRYNKEELKSTVGKMRKALEKYAASKEGRELEATKSELKSCRKELADLQQMYKELDDECETCAQYLKEREEQCRKLKAAKAALETKLQQYLDDTSGVSPSVRKKRQSIHDQNRTPTPHYIDAATETSDDLLSYQVERDSGADKDKENAQARELQYYKMAYGKVCKEKTALEQIASTQMVAAIPPIPPTMYVATGSAIVQNQQLSDVLKENQKLKRMNTKLIQICKKRGKSLYEACKENEESAEIV